MADTSRDRLEELKQRLLEWLSALDELLTPPPEPVPVPVDDRPRRR